MSSLTHEATPETGAGTPTERPNVLARIEAYIDFPDEDLPAEDRQLIGQVCETILSGQRLDVQRFGVQAAHAVVALRTRQEVEDYTWRVAGCVGEFWGLICETHLPGWRQADLSVMIAAGIRYGQALQQSACHFS